jgi:hypothetical protein
MIETRATTTVWAVPADTPTLRVPDEQSAGWSNPTMNVGGGVQITGDYTADHEGIAAWWRTLAAAAATAADWHERRAGVRDGAR